MITSKISKIYKFIICAFIFLLLNINIVKAESYETIINDLNYLENLANSYKIENNIQTDTKLLITSYIRDGAYDESWNEYGFPSDMNFEQYVSRNSSNLAYLKNIYSITTPSGDTIDFKRLMSNLNILLNRGSLFGNWISDIYDLTIIISGSSMNSSSEEIAKTYYNSFSSQGCITNIDSYNIYKKYGNSLSDTFKNYYSTITQAERFKQFTTNLGVLSFSQDSIRTSVEANFKGCEKIIELLNLKGLSIENNSNLIKGACYAYADYIYFNHPERTLISEININESDLFMEIGAETELNIKTNPQVDKSLITLKSSSPEVISIVNGSKIRAISDGTATITATCSGLSKSIKVTVMQNITDISFAQPKVTINAGSAIKLEPIITPKDNKDYVFETTNPAIVDIDEEGNIFSYKAGTAEIYCKSKKNPSIFAKCEIEVTQLIEYIKIHNENVSLRKGDSCKLNVSISPENYTDNYIYSSLDESIARVDSTGNITAVGVGQTVITCMSESNPQITSSCNVTVNKIIDRIYFDSDFQTIDIAKANKFKFNVYLNPSTASTSQLTYEVSDKSIATFDSRSMNVTVLKEGSFSITCRSKDDPTVSAKCNFYVLDSNYDKTTPTPSKHIQYEKEDTIEVENIVDKNDTLVEKEEENLLTMDFIKKVIVILVLVAAIIVVLTSIVATLLTNNKDKIKSFFGFEEDFDDEEDEPFDDEDHYESINNVFKIKPQTEKDFIEMTKKLEEEYNIRKLKEEKDYENLTKELEEQRKQDMEDIEGIQDIKDSQDTK